MKYYMIPLTLLLFFTMGCNSSDETNAPDTIILPAQDLSDVAYGNDVYQKMDVYLPEGRNENTKTFILVHGGGWSGGHKTDFDYVIPILKTQFPG